MRDMARSSRKLDGQKAFAIREEDGRIARHRAWIDVAFLLFILMKGLGSYFSMRK